MGLLIALFGVYVVNEHTPDLDLGAPVTRAARKAPTVTDVPTRIQSFTHALHSVGVVDRLPQMHLGRVLL